MTEPTELNGHNKEKEIEPEKPLSREQRRAKERVETEARQVHERMCEKFTDFMIECEDPDGPEVAEKAKSMSAQWKMFCKSRGLKENCYNFMEKYCETVIAEFKRLKEEQSSPVLQFSEIEAPKAE